ncbi:MAG: hypothetical protein JXQ87_02130 [Bacteroidia bacterium]
MKSFFTIFCITISVALFAGGPWPAGKGNGYFQPGFTAKNWDGRYQGTYANTIFRDLNRKAYEYNITFYGEYGISDKITLIADAFYRFQGTEDEILNAQENPFSEILPSGNLSAPGNPAIQLKYHFKIGSIASAAYLRFQPNFSSADEVIGLRTDYDANAYTSGIMLGQGFEKSYWSFDAGIAVRSNNYAESVVGNFQYGYAIRPKTYLILDINYMVSLENGTNYGGSFEQTATYLDNQGFVAYGAKLYSQFHKNLSFNIAFYSGFAVINQGNQPGGIFGGIAYQLNKND